MDISLTPEMEDIVQQSIARGYQSPSAVVYAGLRLLQKQDREKFESLRQDLIEAHEQLRRGESSPLDGAAIERIKTEGRERWEKKQKAKLNGESY